MNKTHERRGFLKLLSGLIVTAAWPWSEAYALTGFRAVTMGKKGKFTSLSFRAAANGSNSVTIPATVAAGDLMILGDLAVNSSGTPSDVIPTGWTGIGTTAGTTRRIRLSYKIATGTDAGSSVSGMTGTSIADKNMVIFRPNRNISLISALGYAGQVTNSVPTPQSIPSSGGTAPTLVIGHYSANGSIATRSMTPSADGEQQGAGTGNYIDYKFYNVGSTPADVTVSMSDSGTNHLQSCYFVMS